MSKHNYLDQIAHKIDAHRQTIEALQREIDKLEGAAEVITQLRGNDGGATLTLEAQPDKKVSPAFTIRKIDPEKKISVGRGGGNKGRTIDRERGNVARGQVMDLMRTVDAHGVTTADINHRLGFTDRRDRQLIWNVVSQFKIDGKLVRDEDGRYHLPPTE
jgi:hypothetical protein